RCMGSTVLLLTLLGCGAGFSQGPAGDSMSPAAALSLLAQLSDDSLRGRMTTTPGADKAAVMIAREMQRIGLAPAGDSGYFQRVPYTLRVIERAGRPTRMAPRLAASFAALDSV